MTLILGMPDDEYHAAPGINASLLKLVRRSPAHARAAMDAPRESKALDDGRAIHLAVLEPERFLEVYAVEPEDAPRRPTKAQVEAKNPAAKTMEQISYWDEFDSHHVGKIAISAEDAATYTAIRDAVWAHPDALALLTAPGDNEASIFADCPVTGLRVKARFDRLLSGVPVGIDLKTTEDASLDAFQKSLYSYGYHIQDAHYDAVYEAHTGQPLDAFAFIVVEKKPPHGVEVYYLDQFDRQLARDQRDHLLAVTGGCMESGIWPSYKKGIKKITLPAWARKQITEALTHE